MQRSPVTKTCSNKTLKEWKEEVSGNYYIVLVLSDELVVFDDKGKEVERL